jgi:hypothetical protein
MEYLEIITSDVDLSPSGEGAYEDECKAPDTLDRNT